MKWLAYFAVAYLLILAYGIWFSGSLIFPVPKSYYHLEKPFFSIPVSGKQSIAAVYLTASKARYTILYSHGNAEDLGTLMPILQAFVKHGYSVLAYDYRGYGRSDGHPSEKHLNEDIRAAYDYLALKLKTPANHILLYGRSLGSGPSVDLAKERGVAGLIIENGFVSIFRVMTHFTLFPFDKFNNLAKIRSVKLPVLIIHGTKDEVVPLWHGRALFDAAPDPKQQWWVEGHTHNVWVGYRDTYWKTLASFTRGLR